MFLVGRDARNEALSPPLRQLAGDGHEFANHSFGHQVGYNFMHPDLLSKDFDDAEIAIQSISGKRPIGFRAPSFQFSEEIHKELIARDYLYDSSKFPTFFGPIARVFHFSSSSMSREERHLQKHMFGKFSDGFTTLKPHYLPPGAKLLEFPISTFPVIRSPVHMTYVNFIADLGNKIGELYFQTALKTMRISSLPFTLLLHATDFLGSDDGLQLGFLPGMKGTVDKKLMRLERLIGSFVQNYHVDSLEHHAKANFQSSTS